MQAVILCGGLGTRMGGRVKSLIPVRGRPLIDWQLDRLLAAGFDDIVLCLGFGAEQITTHIEDRIRLKSMPSYGSVAMVADGNKVANTSGKTLLGTAGALRHALALEVLDEEFLVTYGDSFIDYKYGFAAMALAQAAISKLGAVITVCESLYGAGNIAVSDDGKFVRSIVKHRPMSASVGLHGVMHRHDDYGAIAIRRDALAYTNFFHADLNDELGAWARTPATDPRDKPSGFVRALMVPERFHEIGSPQGLSNLEAHLGRKEAIT